MPKFDNLLSGAVEIANLPLTSAREYREKEMEAFVEQLGASERVHHTVLHGDVSIRIQELIRKQNIDLMLMPTWGVGPYRPFVFGSTTAKLLHDVPCPVLTGRHDPDLAPVDSPPYKRIACALDLSDCSDAVLRWAADFSTLMGAELDLIHAAPWIDSRRSYLDHMSVEYREALIRHARHKLESFASPVGRAVTVHIDSAEPVRFIDESVARLGSDLLVIGRGHHIEGISGRLRSNAYALIRSSPCPVVSI